jgi:site-specific recombinase XerD
MTLDDALIKFEDYLTGQKHPVLTITTYVKNVQYFREYLRENSLTTSVSELCREDVTEYLISLAKTGISRSSASSAKNTDGLSATTLKKKLAAIRKFSIFLLESGCHKTDITNGIKSPRISKREPAFLNQGEYKLLLYETNEEENRGTMQFS